MSEKIIIIILCRMVTINMYHIYHRYFNNNDFEIIFISDYPGYLNKNNIIYIDDEEMKKQQFINMTTFKKFSSWDKAMFYLSNRFFNYFWIIEDDVYLNSNISDFIKNINSSNYHDLITFSWIKKYNEIDNYIHFIKGKDFFLTNELGASLNVFCRISSKLLDRILEFNMNNNTLIFHEVLLISLCYRYNMKISNFRENTVVLYSGKSYNLEKKELIDFLENNNKICYHPFKKWWNYLS